MAASLKKFFSRLKPKNLRQAVAHGIIVPVVAASIASGIVEVKGQRELSRLKKECVQQASKLNRMKANTELSLKKRQEKLDRGEIIPRYHFLNFEDYQKGKPIGKDFVPVPSDKGPHKYVPAKRNSSLHSVGYYPSEFLTKNAPTYQKNTLKTRRRV